MRLGKYEIGKTLGHGNFGKVKFAIDFETQQPFAVKELDKTKIIDLNITHQFKREIYTLKLLKHPNIVRLHEVLASKSKIYMVLEYVNGGELYYKIASKGMLSEAEGKKVFQQLIDGVSYCHSKGVYHRDLKLENILVDIRGNIKISDFGLCALQEHLRDISEKKIRFTTNQYSTKEDIFKQMEFLVTEMGFLIHRKDGRLKVMREMERGENGSVTTILSISAKVFEISPSLYVVELKKLHGDSSSFRQLCKSLSSDLGIPPGITRDDITSSVL